MIFSVQRFVEDHLERRGLDDVDQYAVRIASAFDRLGSGASEVAIARACSRIRTVFFRRHRELDRKAFEKKLATLLKRRFKKKSEDVSLTLFTRALPSARSRLRKRRRSIGALMEEFKRAVEARGVGVFWVSRKDHKLRSRPEAIAQGFLEMFAKGVIGNKGLVLREMASGIGFVDVGVSFGDVLHLIELKILKGALAGEKQLATYMRTESRREGWLVLFDTRRVKHTLPDHFDTKAGTIWTVVVDVNPYAPHAA